jgi:dolichol-phosphate mannosyltransferase
MHSSSPSVSIIVPTYREADNLPTLIERVFVSTREAGLEAELIIVDDDSNDGTEEIVAAWRERVPVRLLIRREERGLSGAVLRGFEEARYDTLLVMDADLQHPPEAIPSLVRRLHEGDCDFVVGSRYASGGRIVGDWSWFRRLNSWAATAVARPLVRLTDPMSGFFALHRRTWEQASGLDPIGYKIALELMVKGGCERPAEVPITFETRRAGESKLSLREQLRYLRHLARLYRFRYPLVCGFAVFAVVVAVGAAVLGLLRWLRFGS